jgi:hypothetical protein
MKVDGDTELKTTNATLFFSGISKEKPPKTRKNP